MIDRKALKFLAKWKDSEGRKPLVIRGARQVGKTTLVKEFAKQYDVFLDLNLEKLADRRLFEDYQNVQDLITAIFFYKEKRKNGGTTLLFIDEIQFSKRAIAILRYFYEEANDIHVIVAGSLLESVIDVRKISFPVGRVQYMALGPCSFFEFLNGTGKNFDIDLIQNLQVESVVHERIIKNFYTFTLIGGMPAVVSRYAENQDVLSLKEVYESLLISYQDDVEKYTKKANLIKIIRTILSIGWASAGEIISFECFGGTAYSSKEINAAFQTIQKAMLLDLIYSTPETQIPLIQNFRRHPKLVWLDTGLVNFAAGIQKEVFSISDIQDIWRGRIAEHVVAQELLTLSDSLLTKRIYWRRDKQGSEAEVDFIYPYNNWAIPIEVKSGHNSKLKSLHLFMDSAPHHLAVRVCSNPFSIDDVNTSSGKKFKLINLPFYYIGVLDKVLERINMS
ncbi:MAG: AAA family ATPase [Prevotellaceae bacterium]|jgi:predicted AAA+ superfamily ATPase|nr:AAA family ATPase [Prevotellaceae bacterium]